MQKGQSGVAGITLAKKVGAVLCPDTIGLVIGGFTRAVGTDDPRSEPGPA